MAYSTNETLAAIAKFERLLANAEKKKATKRKPGLKTGRKVGKPSKKKRCAVLALQSPLRQLSLRRLASAGGNTQAGAAGGLIKRASVPAGVEFCEHADCIRLRGLLVSLITLF